MKKSIAVGAALCVTLAGCGGGGPRSSGGSKLTGDKIVLGVLNDQSGVYAQLSGKNSVVAVQMAIDDFKAKYGDKAITKNITVESADHQNKPDVANTRAQEMYDRDGVDAILDVPTSSAALKVADVAKQSKKLYFNISGATTDLTGKSCNKYTFHYAYDTAMLANGTGTAATQAGAKNWYIVYPDYAFGQDMQKSFTAAVKKGGGTVVASDPTPFPNDNFSTFLLKAPTLNPKPDVLGTMQAGADLVNLVKQYNEFKLKDKGVGLAVADVAKQDKKLYFNIGAASDDLNGKSCNKYTFHYAYDTNMLANVTGKTATKNGAKSWYLIYPNYAFGQDMLRGFTTAIGSAGGAVVASAGSPFPNPTQDYSTLLLKTSGLSPKPDTLGVMQAGGDLQNVVKQYNQFKLKDQGVKLAVGLMFITDIHALGPDALAGTTFTDAWYWNANQDNRAFADKFYAKTKTRPTFDHAADYSAALQYLEAVQAAGTDDSDKVVAKLEGKTVNDVFLHNGTIRAADHLVTHDAYLAQVKPSSQVTEPWDYEKILETIPADQAFNQPSSDCHM